MTPACRRTVTGSRDYAPRTPSGSPPEGSLYTSAMSREVLERRLDALVARRLVRYLDDDEPARILDLPAEKYRLTL